MSLLLAILCGVVCGLAAATPLVILLRGNEKDLGRGLAAVIAAFMIIQVAMLGVHAWWPHLVAPFGVTATLTFLTTTIVGASTVP